MKPTSIVFLVISVILAIGGFAAMKVAENLAAEEGIELLSTIDGEQGDYTTVIELAEDTVGKVSLNIKEADIKIIGGADSARLELVNFPDGMYEHSSSNRILTVSNNSDFSSVSGIASLAMSFKGLRSLVNLYNISGLDKQVTLYLPADTDIKIVDVKLGSGRVTVDNCATPTDYLIEIDNGSAKLRDIYSGSSTSVKLDKGDVSIDSSIITSISLEINDGDAKLSDTDMNVLDAELGNGDFTLDYRYELEYINLDLFTKKGSVRVDGENLGGYFEALDRPSITRMTVTTEAGDIVLSSVEPETPSSP